LRKAYQDQQTAGLMTLEELVSKLKDLDETRLLTERALGALKDSQARVEELEEDWDTLLEFSSPAKYPKAWTASTVRSEIPSIGCCA
jgi:hypothetical protein